MTLGANTKGRSRTSNRGIETRKQKTKQALGRYRARCLLCPWVSESNTGPVFAGDNALAHSKILHPDAEGIVAIIEKEN